MPPSLVFYLIALGLFFGRLFNAPSLAGADWTLIMFVCFLTSGIGLLIQRYLE